MQDRCRILGLYAVAIEAPVLGMLRANPDFFITRRIAILDLAGLLAVLCVIVPALLILKPTKLTVAALATLLLLPSLPWPLALALGVAVSRATWPPLTRALTGLAGAAVLIPALFLTSDVVQRIVLPAGAVSYPQVSATAPVVMLVLDELPTTTLGGDTIDEARFPNFARLARGSTWYRRATSVADSTVHAVPAILTGRYPHQGYPVLADHPHNLFTLLGGHYRLEAEENLTRLCPQAVNESHRLLSLLGEVAVVALSPRQGNLPQTWEDCAPHAVRTKPQVFADFVARLEPHAEPTLYFLHTLLPHAPWIYRPDGTLRPDRSLPGLLPGDRWGADVAEGHRRHVEQARYTDRLLGTLLDRLQQNGLYDRCLLVVVADHGVSFVPNQPRRTQTSANTHQLRPVPLFIKAPGQTEGQTDDAPALTVDVLPTVCELLGTPLPWKVDGQSLLHPLNRTVLPMYDYQLRPLQVRADHSRSIVP